MDAIFLVEAVIGISKVCDLCRIFPGILSGIRVSFVGFICQCKSIAGQGISHFCSDFLVLSVINQFWVAPVKFRREWCYFKWTGCCSFIIIVGCRYLGSYIIGSCIPRYSTFCFCSVFSWSLCGTCFIRIVSVPDWPIFRVQLLIYWRRIFLSIIGTICPSLDIDFGMGIRSTCFFNFKITDSKSSHVIRCFFHHCL